MGNKHGCSEEYYRDNWKSSSHAGSLYYGNRNHNPARTEPNFVGALDRIMGQKMTRQARKASSKALKQGIPIGQTQVNLENLYGRNYQQSANISQNNRITTNIPLQRQPSRQIEQRPQVVYPIPPSGVRRPSLEMPIHEEFQAICQFCNDKIIPEFYNEHIEYCEQNPKNWKKTCDYCGVSFDLKSIQRHMQNCEAKIENLRIPCDFCGQEISLSDQHYHESTCTLNPRNLSRTSSMENSQTKNQVPECAICLLEMKRDGTERFLECAHEFHAACIEDWSKKKKTCPVCQTPFS